MSKKAGRPKLPKNESRSVMLSARFSKDEIDGILNAVKRSGLAKTEWVRNSLLNAAKQ